MPTEFSSNGERIYFTGNGASGRPILATGGDLHMGMHRQMHGGGCATCHGANKEGRRLLPRFWVKAPALTTTALFGSGDHGHEESGHGDHAAYDDETLRRAITTGIDPSGEPLDPAMPRWSMSESDLDDLLAYLGVSKEH